MRLPRRARRLERIEEALSILVSFAQANCRVCAEWKSPLDVGGTHLPLIGDAEWAKHGHRCPACGRKPIRLSIPLEGDRP